ncbi:MAG: ATP-binding protein [Prevotella sp.]|nr:ATP-binding protein [Prevotella sp.]
MGKAFVYGMSVGGDNFTDRIEETKRIKLDFENGINVILISPRRMGKTSLIKKVISEMDSPEIKVVYMDIYDCRSEYDFYNRFAETMMKSTGNQLEQVMENIKRFLVRVSPKLSFSPEPNSEFSVSLGITSKDYSPEEILDLPERIAKEQGIKIVVCIDEFQQIGEFADSLTVQKRLRGVWQHHQHVSYCFFGSKKHLMENIFQSRRMPFYQFGEMLHLKCIPTEYWVPFICSRFEKYGKEISEEYAARICHTVKNYSSYVQQLAWNVMAETEIEVNEESFTEGFNALLEQNSSLFIQQTEGLTTYQLNFIRLLCNGIHSGFNTQSVVELYSLGSKSNVDRIKKCLIDRELITIEKEGVFLADCVFELWFKREMM